MEKIKKRVMMKSILGRMFLGDLSDEITFEHKDT